ncbi:MAG TPA: hypothetical protein VFA30_10670 [Gaiellaceae bacterium]|nr:hypothetical protein [Gaiellaceae bacterium]
MARAAVKARQQAKKATVQPQRQRARGGRRKHAGGGNPNQQLFFVRMRRNAKPMYVILAVLFAATFAVLGVGSGSNSGLDQIFSGLNLFGHGGTSVSKAQKYIDKHPKDPKGYRELATAYEAKNETGNAIGALQQLTSLDKKDAAAWNELAGLQYSQAQQYESAYENAYTASQLAAPSTPFMPTGKLGTALGTNQVEQAAAQQANTGLTSLGQSTQSSFSSAISSYQTAAKLQPGNSNTWLQLAQVAQTGGNSTVAVTAYKRYLKLNPDAATANEIKQLIKELSPAPAAPKKKKK